MIEKLRALVDAFPRDARARYFLAHELFKSRDWAGAAAQYEAYLELEPGDEGVGFKNLGLALERLGRAADAAQAYRKGLAAAEAHHHDGLASEIRFLLEALDA